MRVSFLNIGIFIASLGLFSTSCTEIPPEIPEINVTGDKKVIVEDFTGVRCTNCPTAAAEIANLNSSFYQGNLIPVSIHAPKYSTFTEPYSESKYDFRVEEANKIAELVESEILGLPSAMFDRYDYDLGGENGHVISNVSIYQAAIDERINLQPKLLISLENNYDSLSRELTTTASIRPTETIDEPLYITFMLLENGIVDVQNDKEEVIEHYVHDHVLRDVYSFNPKGDEIQQALKAEQVIEISRSVTIPEMEVGKTWNNPDSMETVVHVHRRGNALTSLQAEIEHVKD